MRRYVWLIAILLGLVVFAPDPGQSRAIGAAHDFAHAPAFGLVCWLILLGLRRWRVSGGWNVRIHYAIAVAGATALGLATEVAQHFTGRDSSWVDLRSDALGAAAFAGLFALVDTRICNKVLRVAGAVLGVLAILWQTLPLVTTVQAYVHRNQDFPALLNATDDRADAFIETANALAVDAVLPAEFAHHPSERALFVAFRPGAYPGLELIEPVADWSGFRTLAVDVTNPEDEALPIVMRVHDRTHNNEHADRYNGSFTVPARTRTTLEIPLTQIKTAPQSREIDLAHIAGLVLFTNRTYAGRTIYVSKISLENDH